jgi:c-di-GMP-binding flagellar brake protein YcgR
MRQKWWSDNMLAQGLNRRVFFRVGTNIDAILQVRSNKYLAKIVDISTGGLQLVSSGEMLANEMVTINFDLYKQKVTAYSKIVRAVKGDDSEFLYGCKYEYIDDLDMQKICSFLFDTQAMERWS